MAPANNDSQQHPLVQVALIADAEQAQRLASAINACPRLRLHGQAGMAQSAALPDIPWQSDTRVLAAQTDVDAIVLAASVPDNAELAGVGLRHGTPVWQLPPLAPSFAEAAELVTLARQVSTTYSIASWWEHVLDHGWNELPWPEDFRPIFSDLRVNLPGPTPSSSPGKQAASTGGVLAGAAYPLLEALVAVRGLPDGVCSAVGTFRTPPGPTTPRVEDTAVAILRYADGGTGVISAARNLPGREHQLRHVGPDALVTLTDRDITLADHNGRIIDHRSLPEDYLASEMHRLAALIGAETSGRPAPLERHLEVSALLDAIQLSARTGHPESPARLYKLQGRPEPLS